MSCSRQSCPRFSSAPTASFSLLLPQPMQIGLSSSYNLPSKRKRKTPTKTGEGPGSKAAKKLLTFLMGDIMKRSKGAINPVQVCGGEAVGVELVKVRRFVSRGKAWLRIFWCCSLLAATSCVPLFPVLCLCLCPCLCVCFNVSFCVCVL